MVLITLRLGLTVVKRNQLTMEMLPNKFQRHLKQLILKLRSNNESENSKSNECMTFSRWIMMKISGTYGASIVMKIHRLPGKQSYCASGLTNMKGDALVKHSNSLPHQCISVSLQSNVVDTTVAVVFAKREKSNRKLK